MTKEARVYNGAKTVFSTVVLGQLISTCKKMNLDSDIISFTKIHSKWITGLNIKCKAIKLLEDNIGEYLHDLGYGNDLFFCFLRLGQPIWSV